LTIKRAVTGNTAARRARQRGSAMVEFTLVGIGLIFVLISIFEMARGMWIYHTLAHTSKEATRYLIVHGAECQARPGCSPGATLGALAGRMRYHGVGLLPDQLQVQVFRGTTKVVGGGGFATLQSLNGSTVLWDTAANRGQAVRVVLRYPFRSALAMLWPTSGSVDFMVVNLGASSWDEIQF
jgi:hypothetical protein